MTESFIYDYFELLAIKHPLIQHSEDKPAIYKIMEGYDLDEFDSAVRAMKSKTVLLLEIDDSTTGEADAPFEWQPIRLHFLQKPDSKKFEIIRGVRDNMKTVGLDFVGHMRQDGLGKYESITGTNGVLKAAGIRFDSRLKWGNMNKVDGVWYGKTLSFEWKTPIDLSYKPANWS